MDPLTQQLIQRQLAGGGAQGGSVPAVPPNPQPRLPQAAKRWVNAQQLQQAYANGWSPNPMLLRASLGNK